MFPAFLTARNTYAVLVYRLLIAILLYTMSRLIFLLLNLEYFGDLGWTSSLKIMLAGVRFDASIIVISNALFIIMFLLPFPFRERPWYGKTGEIIFYIINGAALLANCLDAVYFPFSLKRSTADIFQIVTADGGGDFIRLLPAYLIDFWYIFVIWAVMVFVMVILYRLTKRKTTVPRLSWSYILLHMLGLATGLALGFIISRGGVQLRPLSLISAGEYTQGKNVPLVLNTPFTIFHTIGREQLGDVRYFSNEREMNAVFSPLHHYEHPADSLKKLNVLIIVLEGFSKENFAGMNPDIDGGNYKGYCPFLDSLSRNSLNFRMAFSNGKKSIEGIPAVVAAMPNLMEQPFITSSYAGNSIQGLASILGKEGYSSAFFHGGTNGTMQFDAFTSVAGYQAYFGRNEYGNDADYDGKWGIYDGPFLQYSAREIDQMQEPFLATVFTLSSHHPYLIPEEFKGKFPKGRLEIHESIAYTDYALKQFFETIQKMPWYENTLFVITSDHSSLTFSPYYQSSMGKFAIPMFYYRPDHSLTGDSYLVTQQADIMPSVLDYLGYNKCFLAFGNSVFREGSPHFSVCYYNGIYQLIFRDYIIEFNGEKIISAFRYSEDPLLERPLDPSDASLNDITGLVKALIQSYNTRVRNNQLSCDHE